MKSRIVSVVRRTACLLLVFATWASAASNDDWDMTTGTIVTATSGTLGGDDPLDMFGGSSGLEGANLLFQDLLPAGSVHFVEWETPVAKTIARFNLVATHDSHASIGPARCGLETELRDSNQRGFNHFRLLALNPATQAFDIVLYDQPIALGDDNFLHPGEGAQLYDPQGVLTVHKSMLDLTADVQTEVLTNKWRAEFAQQGCESIESGPRVIELDGFTAGGPSTSAVFARDDYVVAYVDNASTYQLLANDGATGSLDFSSIRIQRQPGNGTATANPNGLVVYQPNRGFHGSDSFTYTVQDKPGAESNPATVHITVKNEPPFTGCVFTRPNRHIHFHHPSLYLPEVQRIFQNPQLDTIVQVFDRGVRVADSVPVAIQASDLIFPDDSALPQRSAAAALTGANGTARFVINPPKPDPTGSIRLDATATLNGIDYACSGTIVTGLGARLEPYVSALDSLADTAELSTAELAPARLARGRSKRERAAAERPGQMQPLPLLFERAAPDAGFVARVRGRRVRIASDRLALSHNDTGELVELEFIGANPHVAGRATAPLPGRSHYLVGAEPELWRTGVTQTARVRFDEAYPGVALDAGRRRRLEYDFVLSPQANPAEIRMRLAGGAAPRLEEDGALASAAHPGIRLEAPLAYQRIDGERREVAAAYAIADDGSVGFELGDYDRGRELVIDPVLEFSSFFGGVADDSISALAVDGEGNIYVAGSTSSAGLASGAAYQTEPRGGDLGEADAFVAKLDPSGSSLLYLTYLGGSGDDVGFGLAVDAEGNAVVSGTTSSLDFPLSAAYQDRLAHPDALGFDAFVAKLGPDGSSLIYSTYLGGTGTELESSVALDAAGHAWVVSNTTSADIPTYKALQEERQGRRAFSMDVLLAKLDPAGGAETVTYLGGSGEDWGLGVDVDGEGAVWVTGMSNSFDFPAVNAFQNANRGGFDAFLTKVSPAGDQILYSTYLGGSSDDSAQDVAVGADGSAHLVGSTGSEDFPAASEAVLGPLSAEGLGQDAFAAKFSPAGEGLLYSTLLGGSADDLGQGAALAADGGLFIAGDTASDDLILAGEIQSENAGGYDAFAAKLDAMGGVVEFATYFGGANNDGAAGLAVDADGNALIAGAAFSTDFPITNGALQQTAGSRVESFVAKLAPGGSPFATVSAASFSADNGTAPDSIVSGFGTGLAGAVEVATATPLPTELAGARVRVTDSSGLESLAPLFFVSPNQINYLFPSGAEPGPARVQVEAGGRVVAQGSVQVSVVAPSLFTANAQGTGVAAALYLRVAADGSQTRELLFNPADLSAVAVDLGPEGEQVYLLLFGTGVRGFNQQVAATVGGLDVGVLGAVAQPDFVGLDQINIGPLPSGLAGAGEVEIVLSVDGVAAPPVSVTLR